MNTIKNLNLNQYQTARENALKAIETRIGDKPNRDAFKRESAPVWELMDGFLIIVFIAAFAVSTLHIFDFSRIQALAAFEHSAYTDSPVGIGFSSWFYAAVHQVAMVLLAEFSMLTFFTYWGLERKRATKRGAKGIVSFIGGFQGAVSLLLGSMAFAFVFYVNLTSGVFILMAITPPAVLLGVGFRLERVAIELLTRKRDMQVRYETALTTWELASKDPEQHPDFRAIFRQSIFERLTALKSNKWLLDANMRTQQIAVAREMRRENTFAEAYEGDLNFEYTNGHDSTQPGDYVEVVTAQDAGF